MLYGIPAHVVDDVWDEVRPWITAACKRSRGKFDENDIRIGLLERDDQLWIWRTETSYAVGVTRIVVHPQMKVCSIRLVTGRNRVEWEKECIARIESWAKSQGCEAMELQARPGWKTVLPDYDMTHIVLEKRL